jgi:poly(A) polymerase
VSREAGLEVVRRLRAGGYQAYFAGGCVRDLLLEREPKDYDVATDATPEQVLAVFPGSLEVGARFGVVVVPSAIEVATFRNDGVYTDGRHPASVSYTHDAREDAARRDFTINGMFYDPLEQRTLDYVGGEADLRAGVIRAIGDPQKRFQEDRLRLVRAVRFAARLGFRIEEQTWDALLRMREGVRKVSAERLRDELTRILTEGAARRGFELLETSGLLAELLPEVAAMKGVAQPPEFHPEGDVWTHTLMLLEGLEQPSPALAWGALLHDVGKPPTFTPPQRPGDRIRFHEHAAVGARMAEAICARMRFSGRDLERVAALVENHLRFIDVPKMRPATLKRFLRLEHFDEHLELHRLDCLASHGKLDTYESLRETIARLGQEQIRPPALLTGHDLIALGYQPGPVFQKILREVEDAHLEGELHTTADARNWVLARFPH